MKYEHLLLQGKLYVLVLHFFEKLIFVDWINNLLYFLIQYFEAYISYSGPYLPACQVYSSTYYYASDQAVGRRHLRGNSKATCDTATPASQRQTRAFLHTSLLLWRFHHDSLHPFNHSAGSFSRPPPVHKGGQLVSLNLSRTSWTSNFRTLQKKSDPVSSLSWETWGICTCRAGYRSRSRCGAVRIPDKSSKTDGTGSSLPDLDKKTVTLRSLDWRV